MSSSVFDGNSATGTLGAGGALFASGNVSITETTFSNNQTPATTNFGGGALVMFNSNLTLTISALFCGFSNRNGGAILICDATLNLSNMTLSGNNAKNHGGGGRYLLDTIKLADLGQQDGKPVLDFNYAYNPSCSYDSRWTCPLAPRKNGLNVRVVAGEQRYPGAI